ncbi:MAG: zinc ribbon domain-containing protein [Synechococcaceae cyanobacterium]|nr:zinc ribbon domain-containing protein [Synechococcaceae cyanobacterium]
MGRTSWLWLLLALLLLLPGSAGRFLVDLIGGLTLTLLVVAVVLGAGGLVAWQRLRSRLRACPSCGTLSVGQPVCPACGTLLDADPSGAGSTAQPTASRGRWAWGREEPEIDPRTVTINVEAVDVGQGDISKGNGRPAEARKQDPSKPSRG